MKPLLRQGAVAAVKKSLKYMPGDIIAYEDNDTVFIHRILKLSGSRFFVRDDTGAMDGAWVEEENVIGLVLGASPRGIAGICWNIISRAVFRIHNICKG